MQKNQADPSFHGGASVVLDWSPSFWRDWLNSQPSFFVLGDNVSADLRCSFWAPLDTFKGHNPQLHHRGPHKQNKSKGVGPDASVIAHALVLILHCAASFKMRRILLKRVCRRRHPALNKMSIFILWAEFVSCACYIQFRCISFWFKVTKIRWKNSTSGTWKLPLWCQDGRKRRGVGGWGCHGSVRLCVGHHYDNKHSSRFHSCPSL